MPLLSLRAYSRHRGCTLRAVQKAIESGRIEKTADGKIDSEVADAKWLANTDPRVQGGGPKVQANPTHVEVVAKRIEPVPEVTHVPPGASAGDDSPFVKARTQRETFEAKRAQLKYELEAKELLPAEEAKKFFFGAGRIYSASRESIPTHLAPLLAGKTDLGEIERIVRQSLRDADKKAAESIEKQFQTLVGVDVSSDRDL